MIREQTADGLGAGRGVWFLGNEGVESGEKVRLHREVHGTGMGRRSPSTS